MIFFYSSKAVKVATWKISWIWNTLKCINFAFSTDRKSKKQKYTESGNKTLNAWYYNISITIADCCSLEWLAMCLSTQRFQRIIQSDYFLCVYIFFFSLFLALSCFLSICRPSVFSSCIQIQRRSDVLYNQMKKRRVESSKKTESTECIWHFNFFSFLIINYVSCF